MKLFKMLMNRKRKFKTWVDGEYIMWDILNMNYYWSHKGLVNFHKVYNLEYLLEGDK